MRDKKLMPIEDALSDGILRAEDYLFLIESDIFEDDRYDLCLDIIRGKLICARTAPKVMAAKIQGFMRYCGFDYENNDWYDWVQSELKLDSVLYLINTKSLSAKMHNKEGKELWLQKFDEAMCCIEDRFNKEIELWELIRLAFEFPLYGLEKDLFYAFDSTSEISGDINTMGGLVNFTYSIGEKTLAWILDAQDSVNEVIKVIENMGDAIKIRKYKVIKRLYIRDYDVVGLSRLIRLCSCGSIRYKLCVPADDNFDNIDIAIVKKSDSIPKEFKGKVTSAKDFMEEIIEGV